jgi:hypothetical protein
VGVAAAADVRGHAVALTGLSFVPDLAIAATSATKVVLMATHVVAAALVVPALAGRLPERSL